MKYLWFIGGCVRWTLMASFIPFSNHLSKMCMLASSVLFPSSVDVQLRIVLMKSPPRICDCLVLQDLNTCLCIVQHAKFFIIIMNSTCVFVLCPWGGSIFVYCKCTEMLCLQKTRPSFSESSYKTTM